MLYYIVKSGDSKITRLAFLKYVSFKVDRIGYGFDTSVSITIFALFDEYGYGY